MLPVPPEKKKRPTLYEMIESQGYISIDSMEGSIALNDAMDVSRPVDLNEHGTRWWKLMPGVGLAMIITLIANCVKVLPFAPFTIEGAALKHPFGVSILAILIGIIVGSSVNLSAKIKLGCKWISAWFIPIAIIFLGSRMDFTVLSRLGLPMLGLVISLMLIAILLAFTVGKALGLSGKACYLLGVGSAVCGSSAILAVAPVSDADEDDVVLAVGAVNLIGLIAMFGCVGLIWWMPEISADLFGSLSGATIHAVPQVVAAAESHGGDASAIASAVKLLRVTLLVPVVLLSVIFIAKQKKTGEKAKPKSLHKYIPWFVWGFVIVALLATNNLIPDLIFPNKIASYDTVEGLTKASSLLLAIAMAAIGLQVNIKSLLTSGGKALLCALIVWIGMATSAYFMFQMYFGG